LHVLALNALTWIFTRIWGHLLIPVLLGSLLWGCTGPWAGWVFVHWLAWVAGMLALGWILTIASWVRYYWAIFNRRKKRTHLN
jgi:hypothetical protein